MENTPPRIIEQSYIPKSQTVIEQIAATVILDAMTLVQQIEEVSKSVTDSTKTFESVGEKINLDLSSTLQSNKHATNQISKMIADIKSQNEDTICVISNMLAAHKKTARLYFLATCSMLLVCAAILLTVIYFI